MNKKQKKLLRYSIIIFVLLIAFFASIHTKKGSINQLYYSNPMAIMVKAISMEL